MAVGSNPASDKSKACELPKSFKSSSLDLFRALIFNIWRNTDARKIRKYMGIRTSSKYKNIKVYALSKKRTAHRNVQQSES